MKRQEELNEAWCSYMGKFSTEIMQALAFALRWCDQHPNWISVKDELPKKRGEYLVFNSVSNTQDVYFYSNGEWWYNAFKCPSGFVTHWMPLPKMPILSNSENIGKDLKGGEQ